MSGAGVEQGVEVLLFAAEVGREDFDGRLRAGRVAGAAPMVAAPTEAPPSSRSSRATEVMTTCLRFIRAMDSATRAGSPRSSSLGRPERTAQKVQGAGADVAQAHHSSALPRGPALRPCWGTARGLAGRCWSLCSSTFFLVSRKSGTAGKLGAEPVGFAAAALEHGAGNVAFFRRFST
jgi:hypothetical protein